MFTILTQGFLFGLAMAPLCALTCTPAFFSMDPTAGKGRTWKIGQFLAGRLAGYAGVGLLFGWLGGRLAGGIPPWATLVTAAALGCAFLLHAVSQTSRRNALCRTVHGWSGKGPYFLVLGLLTGLNICPPFIGAVHEVIGIGGAGPGMAFFMGFFLASAVILAPVMFLALLRLVPAVRSLGRVACAAVGIFFLCKAAALAGDMMRPPVIVPIRAETRTTPVRHEVVMKGDRVVGVVAFSADLAPEAEGFNGHVPVAVTIDLKGAITKVQLLEGHEETAAYYEMVVKSDLLTRLTGKTYTDPIQPRRDVDLVTGATYSSTGVIDAVRMTVRRAAEKLLPLYTKEALAAAAVASRESVPFRFNVWHLGVIVLLGLGILAEAKRMKRMRIVLLIISVACLGVWLQTFFSVKHVLDITSLRFPPWRTHGVWYVLVVGALGSALMTGRVYCGYVCPFGAASELLGRLTRTPVKVSPKLDRGLRRIKYLVLLALIILYAAAPSAKLLLVEPFGDVFSLGFLDAGPDLLLRAGWIVFLFIASASVFRFFCRFLCPAGAALAFLAKNRLVGHIRPDACRECGECTVSCFKREGRP